MDLRDYLAKEFYIIDCQDFIYFARKVHIIAIEGNMEEIRFIVDVKDKMFNEHKKMYKEELEQFKSFEEASKKAKEINEIPENKERAERWNKNKQRISEMQYYSIQIKQ